MVGSKKFIGDVMRKIPGTGRKKVRRSPRECAAIIEENAKFRIHIKKNKGLTNEVNLDGRLPVIAAALVESGAGSPMCWPSWETLWRPD